MKLIDKLIIELNCYNHQQRTKEIMENMTPEQKRAHDRMLLKAEKALFNDPEVLEFLGERP